jgi:hypothetical protein
LQEECHGESRDRLLQALNILAVATTYSTVTYRARRCGSTVQHRKHIRNREQIQVRNSLNKSMMSSSSSSNKWATTTPARHLVKGSVTFDVDTNSPLTKTALVPLATGHPSTTSTSNSNTSNSASSSSSSSSSLPENAFVIFHHDIKGRPYDDGRWFEKHDALARVIGHHSMEVTITSQYPPDETITFSWAARPGLPCGDINRTEDKQWPIVLSGVLAPEYRNSSEIRRTIVSSHLPPCPAMSFRMIGDASGYPSGETAPGGCLPVAFSGIANVQAKRLEDNDDLTIEVTATMIGDNSHWPLEGAIAWIIRAAPTSEEASRFQGVFGCAALVFDCGSCLARTRVHAGLKLPGSSNSGNLMFVAAPLHETSSITGQVYHLDWEDVNEHSFTLIGKRRVAEEAWTVLVDWEVTAGIH